MLVFNTSDKVVRWVYSDCSEPHDHVLNPGFGAGVSGAEAEYVAGLNIPGVKIGPGADEVESPRPNTQERKKEASA